MEAGEYFKNLLKGRYLKEEEGIEGGRPWRWGLDSFTLLLSATETFFSHWPSRIGLCLQAMNVPRHHT